MAEQGFSMEERRNQEGGHAIRLLTVYTTAAATAVGVTDLAINHGPTMAALAAAPLYVACASVSYAVGNVLARQNIDAVLDDYKTPVGLHHRWGQLVVGTAAAGLTAFFVQGGDVTKLPEQAINTLKNAIVQQEPAPAITFDGFKIV